MKENDIPGKVELSPNLNFVDFTLPQGDMKDNTEQDSPIVFYCKDCQELVDVVKVGKRLTFKCKKCKGTKVTFGTKSSLQKFYRIS